MTLEAEDRTCVACLRLDPPGGLRVVEPADEEDVVEGHYALVCRRSVACAAEAGRKIASGELPRPT